MTTRDDAWLQSVLDKIWDNYFSDVVQDNDVRIVFGRRTKRRLGSISLDPRDRKTSLITMNGLFRSRDVPEFVVEATIVHELTHYAHGFNSPLEQKNPHPHAGGVMKREFAERGLSELYTLQKKWLKANWQRVLESELPRTDTRKTAQAVKMKMPKPFWFIGD
jgi:hypothetical protein